MGLRELRLAVSILIRIAVFWGLYWVPLLRETTIHSLIFNAPKMPIGL